jgi:dynein heavy chain
LDEGDDPMDPEQLRADIFNLREKEEDIKKRIPLAVTVSIFSINCKDIRNLYAGKYQSIIEKETKLIAQIAVETNYSLRNQFDQIIERIQQPPEGIDDLTDTKKYITEIGATIQKLQIEIDGCMRMYDIATEFNHEFTNGENDDKWSLYGAPQRVMAVIEEQVQILEKEKERFLKEMEIEQEEFMENLDNLGTTVDGFASYDNMDKYLENAEAVESINQRLQECIEKARMYNQREYLVGKDTTDYSKLQQISKDFLPYSNLWLTTRQWYERHKSWTEGKWEDLDPEELDTTFEQMMKTIK